jgi:predicted nucleic acid-binding protein
MKVLLDTSVLFPALEPKLPAHQTSRTWLSRIIRQDITGAVSTHTLAEVYCNITRFPQKPSVPPVTAIKLIELNILPYFEIVDLTKDDYIQVLRDIAKEGILGGTTYDALIVYAGIKAQVDHIITFNEKHFRRVYPAFAHKIIIP